eukprot:g10021.t1
MQALDPSITVEGIAFDVFGLSEEQARQASSTVLAVFTIAIASAVTIGGIIYDGFGWKGMSVFHVICQSGIALRPAIARRAGGPAEVEEDDNVEDEPKPKGIPKDIRTPSFLIVLCCFNNTAAATWASLAQTSGDLVAAVMMKVLRNNVDEAENVGWLRRITMQPYNLACLLFCWTLCNLGMISPLLPVAVTAQIIMGTVFVYTMKMSTDLNLFYSMGDTAVFLKLQVNCKNAEAIGGCIFSFLGPFLFEHVSAFFPFMVSTFLSALIFIVFSAGFCQRLGCEEIESAESKRSRRLGLRRVSHWSVVSRKNTVVLPNEQDDAEEEDDS